jgi:hypothetical protein
VMHRMLNRCYLSDPTLCHAERQLPSVAVGIYPKPISLGERLVVTFAELSLDPLDPFEITP